MVVEVDDGDHLLLAEETHALLQSYFTYEHLTVRIRDFRSVRFLKTLRHLTPDREEVAKLI